MKTTRLLNAVLRYSVAALSLGLFASQIHAAPGDKLLDAANPGLGAPNNLDPYFLDYNRALGMAALSNGNVVVAWSERQNTSAPIPSPDSPDGANGKNDACFFRVYGPTGTAISAAIRPYLDINADGTGAQNTPMVAALSGGGFVITWNSVNGPGDTFDDGFGFGGDAWARVYDNSGVAVSGTFHVNDNDPNGVPDTQEPTAVVGLSGGGFAILWNDGNDNAAGLGANSNTDDYFLRVFAANGTPAAASARLGGAGQDSFFKDYQAFGGAAQGMVALSDNTVAVGWAVRDKNNDGTGVSPDGVAPNGGGASYFQIFNSSGAAVNSATSPYLDINANASGSQLAPALAALSGGGLAVVWNSNHNTDDGGNSDVGLGGNGTSGGDTYVRVYTNAGAATSSTTRVNDLRTDDSETPASVKALTGGGFAIVWKEDDDNTAPPLFNTDDYYARAFNAAGSPSGASILIGGAAADALFEDLDANGFGMAPLTDGGYAVAIRVRDSLNNGTGTSLDGTAPTGGYSAAVRVFNADGTSRAGPLFPYGDINADFSGNQNIPLVCAIAGGGFAVSWHSNQNSNDTDNDLPFIAGSTSNGGDTYTRIFNNAGTALHATVQAHGEGAALEPTGVLDQQDPFGIIGLTGGNYAIVVRDDNDNTSNKDDLFLSIFEGVPAGGPPAPEIAVTETGVGNVADGGSFSFGTAVVGQTLTKTFTITNSGTANLTLANLTVPAGFTIAANFGSTTVAGSGGTTTFQISMTTTAPATPSGTLTFDNNDGDENPFNFTISGTVNKANTTVSGVSDSPDPSVAGQTVTVGCTVSAVAPGAGTPTGTVTASDGVDSNTGTLSGGVASFSLVLTTPGVRTITFTYNGDTNFNTSNNTAGHLVNPLPPTVTAVAPVSGTTSGGSPVVITGTNFFSVTGVTFDGTAAASFTVVNATTINAVTPPHAAGAVSVVVTTSGGANGANTLFTYVAPGLVRSYTAVLDGPSESPPVITPGAGTATLVIDTVAQTMAYSVAFAGLTANTTAAHVHATTAAPRAGNAAVATTSGSFPGFPLGVTTGAFAQTYDMTQAASYSAAFITANGGTPASAFAALIAAIDSGKAYFNIHSTFAPGGEIRGFFIPAAPAPEIAVTGNSVNITDGDITPSLADHTDFGTTTQGTPFTRTFTIVNAGNATMGTGLVNVGAGFTIVAPLASATVAPGATTTVSVRCNAASVGQVTATVSIANDDSNENPFNFDVTCNVLPPPVGPVVSALGSVVTGEFAPNGAGANDGTKFEVLKRGGFLAENGILVFPANLLVGTGGVTASTSMGLWKHDDVSLKLFARSGDIAPEAGGATFDVLPPTPAINDSGEVTFLATLLIGSGGTTADTDTGLWSELGSTGLGILLRESDPIPGLGGIQVGAFASGAFATAHTSPTTGEAVFSVTMKNGSTDSAILRTSITGAAVTAVQVVARENTAMPLVPGELFGPLASSFSDPAHMDATGNVVFAALTKTTNKESAWYQPVTPAGGAPAKVFIVGDTAPSTGGATFLNIKSPTIGGGGVITFRGFLTANTGDNIGNLKNDGIWRGTGSTVGTYTCILRRGDKNATRAGLGLPNAADRVGNLWHSWLTNANNRGAWIGQLDAGGDGTSIPAPGDAYAIYTDLSGTMTLKIKIGDAAPDIAGATMATFDLPIVGGADQMVFLGKVAGAGITAANNQGVWRTAATGGALSLLLRTGDTMTTTQGVKTIFKLDFPGSGSTARRWEQPVMDATGRVLIFVTFTDGSTTQVLAP